MRKVILVVLILALPTCIGLLLYFNLTPDPIPTRRDAIGRVETFAGSGSPGGEDGAKREAGFGDPFGIAVDNKGNVIVADAGASNRIRRITAEGRVETLAGSEDGFADGSAAQFNTPSGIAIDKSGNIIIADTSNNRIRKLEPNGVVSTVAGSGRRGHRDGQAREAEFDAPVGVGVDEAGNLFVADTYNDRIRKITADGVVSTIAGAAQPGFADGPAEAARFHTPCGIAVDRQGNVFIADTGNDAIRKITPQGEVFTIAGRDRFGGRRDLLNRPIGLALTHDGFLFVANEGAGVVRISPEGELAPFAGERTGFADEAGAKARFNGASGICVDPEGNLYVADSQNYLIRRIVPVPPSASSETPGEGGQPFIQPAAAEGGTLDHPAIPDFREVIARAPQNFPWPLLPQNRPHELTGVVGEARGAPGGVALDHLHSGLDVRGNMGDRVVAVIDEKVDSPIAAWGFGGGNEGIRIGLMSYIHMRVGRDINDSLESADKFKPQYDPTGKMTGMRVRRGTRFHVGESVGTLNRLYHVHLNVGPWNAQANALFLPFVGLRDTVAPVIEPGGVEIVPAGGGKFTKDAAGRLVIRGDVDIHVTAYDRVDGNGANRKLGLFRMGYQLVREDGSPARGFERPLINIDFTRLPPDDESVFKVYAEGSGVSAYGTPTKFKYIVTNLVRDGAARDGVLRTSLLGPGNYTLRVIVEDTAGNRASGKEAEVTVRIEPGV